MPPKGRRAERKAAKSRKSAAVGRRREDRVENSSPFIGHDAIETAENYCGDSDDDEVEIQENYPPTSSREDITPVQEKENDRSDLQATPVECDAITNRNTQQSVLFKLPAELRTHIWELAFGYRTVHPRALRGSTDWRPHRQRLHASKWGVSYDPCWHDQSDQELYELSLKDPNADRWHEDMTLNLGAPGFHYCDNELPPPRDYRYLVPPVCKQLWSEASDCAWKTVTFAFLASGDFQHFMLFSGARVHQIRQLCIITPGTDYFIDHSKEKFERGWRRALRLSAMERTLPSLVGLHLIIRSFWGTSRWGTNTVEELEFPPDECLYLPEIIQTFQPLRLRPNRTTVLVTNAERETAYGYEDFTIPKRRRMAQVIRDLILQEKPDRDWSGPGQRVVMKS